MWIAKRDLICLYLVLENNIICKLSNINAIKKALKYAEKDIDAQKEKFYGNAEYKNYTGRRYDKGYNKCKNDVLKRFKNTCCVCLSVENVVWHHLYSYKYYPDLRTEINNGVCICEICHNNFNDLYGNTNTLEQFIEFRKNDKNKNGKQLTFSETVEFGNRNNKQLKEQTTKLKLKNAIVSDCDNKVIKGKQNSKERENQKKIIDSFHSLKMKLWNESVELERKYGENKGIQIDFRNKKTTSLSAIKKLKYEVTRINTLISCNKIKDKTLMATKFHMLKDDFCNILQDPTQYLNFTDSQIIHLNDILRNDYKEEYLQNKT